MPHEITPEAEAILDKEFPVLDHGFVRLVDYMGGDRRIVSAARTSYGDGTKTVSEDSALIDYLMRHRHTSPFEQVELCFHCKMPIFVARQWVRHRTASLNEVSGRYSVMKDECYVPDLEQIRVQSKSNKQGRGETVSPELAATIRDMMRRDQVESYKGYMGWISQGVAKELARINLPLSLYTEWYWKIDLHNLFHFLDLRLDAHAQWEIRQYANNIALMVGAVAPMAWQAFRKHVLEAAVLTRDDIYQLRKLFVDGQHELTAGSRLKEFNDKLHRLGLEDLIPDIQVT